MSSSQILADRDTNAFMSSPSRGGKDSTETKKPDNPVDTTSMEYHRQMLQHKLSQDSSSQQYVSPSDGIMSPCTAKLSAFRDKNFKKVKPQSLFAKKVKANEGERAPGRSS